MSRGRKVSVWSVMGEMLCVILIPVIFINLALIISTYTEPDEMPGVFGIKPIIVLSGFMEPVTQTEDVILLHSTNPAQLQTGNVICYLDPGQAIIRRTAGIWEGEDGQVRYVVWGDGSNTADRQVVSMDQVQGAWRGGKTPGMDSGIMFMQPAARMILFMICLSCLFILWGIWRRRRLGREKAEYRAALEAELREYRSREKGDPNSK